MDVPPIDSALLPAAASRGSTSDRQAYAAALGFEQALASMLASQLQDTVQSDGSDGSGGSDGSDGSDSTNATDGSSGVQGVYAQMLPDALSSSIESAGGLGLAPDLARALTLGSGK